MTAPICNLKQYSSLIQVVFKDGRICVEFPLTKRINLIYNVFMSVVGGLFCLVTSLWMIYFSDIPFKENYSNFLMSFFILGAVLHCVWQIGAYRIAKDIAKFIKANESNGLEDQNEQLKAA